MPVQAAPRILIGGADAAARAALRGLLESAGCSVCAEACDGGEAIELTSSHKPDAILLGLDLPGVGGDELIRRIRSEQAVPIVAVTDEANSGQIEAALEAGAAGYLVSPFTRQDVVVALVQAFESKAETAIDAARRDSLRMVTDVLGSLKLPQDWAVELEWRCYRAGKLWTRVP